MSIAFKGKQIKCGSRHFAPAIESPSHNVRRDPYFGEFGESEITGGYSGRTISVECWIHDRSWVGSAGSRKLEKYFDDDLVDRIGVHGDLIFAGLYNYTFKNCTLTAVDRSPQFPPRIDDVGLLGAVSSVAAPGVWYTVATLHFRQLKVKNG